jgi:hypothetical protein
MRKFGRAIGFFLLIAVLGCSRGKGSKPGLSPAAALPSVSPVPLVLQASPAVAPLPRPSAAPAKNLADLGHLAKLLPSPGQQGSKGNPAQSAAVGIPQSGPFALFSLAPLKLEFPADFELGVLQAEYPQDEDEKAAALPAYAFLEGLKKGKIDSTVVASGELSKVTQALYPYTKKNTPIVDFRLGRLEIEGESAQAHAALYSQDGIAIAEIYLLKDVSAWKVEAFSADFESLAKPRDKTEKRFEPGEYKVFNPF